MLLRWHTLVTRPSGPFASILGSYLSALSSAQQTIEHNNVELLVENICNLLKITSGQQTSDASPRELQREAVIRYIRRHACKADLSLATVAGDLNMSRRRVQKLLQELQSNFTELLLSERLEIAARQLTASYNGQISTIAYFCGFNDVTHFNHAFKHRFGVTPSQMRSNGRQPG
ncbi:AraC family transcriptional regulator [Paraburkholderia sediminicola]|uniref:helix-turn-helix transcriptional regulator n=1 Tax=Paraburkholderia sediminicola TaxID=458836 RepID=UPI0038BCEFA0